MIIQGWILPEIDFSLWGVYFAHPFPTDWNTKTNFCQRKRFKPKSFLLAYPERHWLSENPDQPPPSEKTDGQFYPLKLSK
jgi:hypothetical protein